MPGLLPWPCTVTCVSRSVQSRRRLFVGTVLEQPAKQHRREVGAGSVRPHPLLHWRLWAYERWCFRGLLPGCCGLERWSPMELATVDTVTMADQGCDETIPQPVRSIDELTAITFRKSDGLALLFHETVLARRRNPRPVQTRVGADIW